jgi:hypothetical protein
MRPLTTTTTTTTKRWGANKEEIGGEKRLQSSKGEKCKIHNGSENNMKQW